MLVSMSRVCRARAPLISVFPAYRSPDAKHIVDKKQTFFPRPSVNALTYLPNENSTSNASTSRVTVGVPKSFHG